MAAGGSRGDRVVTGARAERERAERSRVVQADIEAKAHVFWNKKAGPLTIDDIYEVEDEFRGLYESDFRAAKTDEERQKVLSDLADLHGIDEWLAIRKAERERITALREDAERRYAAAAEKGSKESAALKVMRSEVLDLQKREDALIRSTIRRQDEPEPQRQGDVVISHALEVEDDRAGVVETVSRNLIIEPPFHPGVLEQLALNNSSLCQLVNAMEVNIDGTGWELLPLDTFEMEEDVREEVGQDTEQAEAAREKFRLERERQEKEFQVEVDKQMEGLEGFFKEPWPGVSWTTIRRKLRVDMENTGNAYLEVLRNSAGDIVFARHIDPKLMRLVRLDDPVVVDKEVERGGVRVSVPVSMRERRFVEQVGGGALVPRFTQQFGTQDPSATGSELDTRRLFTSQGTRIVYFREFGSSRHLDMWTGVWEQPGIEIPMERRATEMIHLTGKKSPRTPYGLPRWINNMPSVLGSRKAEEFNLAFFRAGGVPPLLITVAGGQMAERSRQALDEQLNSVNPASKHQAVVLEITGTGQMDKPNKVAVSVERFGSDRMQDAMFLKYDERTSTKIRESFRLPPLFLGDPEAHNFATAKASYLVAEAQVFQPERDEFDEIVTMKLLRNMPNGERFRFHSLPLVIDDAEEQIKCIEIAAGKGLQTGPLVDGEQIIEALNKVCNLALRFDQDTADTAREERMARMNGLAQAFAATSREAESPDQQGPNQAQSAAAGNPSEQIQDEPAARTGTSKRDESDAIGQRLDGLVVLGVDFADALAKGATEVRKILPLLEDLSPQEIEVVRRVATMRAMGDDRDDLMQLFGCTAAIVTDNARP